MAHIDDVKREVRRAPRTWLVTGGAGFIGSHLVEELLGLGQEVRVLDNFATGSRANLDDVRGRVGDASSRLTVLEGDVADGDTCVQACRGVAVVLHQAALGSVPRSLADPLATHRANVDGFVQVLLAARAAGVSRVVYASSSSVYGDHPDLPKVEERIGRPLSPYAASKLVDEVYARVYQSCFGVESVGLRYFNVFGPRQDPNGPYAAVIPKWVDALLRGEPCLINGDGESSRDFCAVDNAVQANLLAALAPAAATGDVYNVAFGARTTLRELFELLREVLAQQRPELAAAQPELGPFRAGDVRHSLADISKAQGALGYQPTLDVRAGLALALPWYVARAGIASC
ncbi:MAG: Vi polysaccharide biosynthesis protein VipB/TviC [Deltaproteobacteria bacterium RBG_16_71_12]|nr:MAG: Vi polysaccharide biosynthesis protein VipB/TviC [Deltaproteobacteria bacterium RBG_16_71_12]